MASIAIALIVVMILGFVLWNLFETRKDLIGAVALAGIAVYLLAELLEPFAWLAGLTTARRRSPQREASSHEHRE